MNDFILPMRPGVSLPPLDEWTGSLPQGWAYQPKLDDERGMVPPEGPVSNRHGRPLATHKARVFAEAVAAARELFPGEWLDVALLGFRGGFPIGSLVLLDLPQRKLPWSERFLLLDALPVGPFESGRVSSLISRLPEYDDPREAWADYRRQAGVEGLIGRNPRSLYEPGDSRNMLKTKWRK